MEGSRRQQQEQSSRAERRGAESPLPAPRQGWREIAGRVKNRIGEDNVSIIAAGTAFYLLLSVVPALSALISIYGLAADPADIQRQFQTVSQVIPAEASKILQDQMTAITSKKGAVGLAAVVSIALALWGGAAAMKALMNALNIIYHEREDRGFVKLTAVALGLTLAFVVIGAISIGLIVALPPVLARVGLGDAGRTAASWGRWPFLLLVALFGLAVLYRYGPSRERPRWQWLTPGAVIAMVVWVAGSALFAVYAQNFGNYNKTYGSLGAIVVMMMWLYVSAFAVLLGAEVNSATENHSGRGPSDRRSAPESDRRVQFHDDPNRQAQVEITRDERRSSSSDPLP